MDNLWTHWNIQREFNKEFDKHWFSITFLTQMVEIEGVMEHIFGDENKLESIRSDRDYLGEPQSIQRVFDIIKSDPKNIALRREIDLAERETYDFLRGAANAPSETYMKEYWSNYLQAWIVEQQQIHEIRCKNAP